MQELDRSTDSVMTSYGSGHIRQALPVGVLDFLCSIITKLSSSIEMELKLTSVLWSQIIDEMLNYSSRKPTNLPDDLLLSLLEVIELCADSYVGLIADKELLLEEVALEETRRNGLQDTSPIATAFADDGVHISDSSVVHFEVLKAFINSPAFWNDLIVLQSEVGKRCLITSSCIPSIFSDNMLLFNHSSVCYRYIEINPSNMRGSIAADSSTSGRSNSKQ